MKKRLLSIICIVFILGGCSAYETEKNITSIAENGIEKVQPPDSCPVVDIGDDEIPISWEYNFETDDSQVTMSGGVTSFADVNDIIYGTANAYTLCYYNKNTMSKGLLCGKPECEHVDSEECNACMPGIINELQYYNGYLYTVNFDGGNTFNLIKISLDGAEREYLGNLLAVEKVKGTGGGGISWIIHRGYIYYYYRCGSGETGDTYYLNNSNCVYRMNLEDKAKECIMVCPSESDSFYCILRGVGSYVYMNMPKNENEGGYLYRFNTETKELERLESLGKDALLCAVYNDRMYYLKKNEEETTVELCCFEYENKEKQLVEAFTAIGCNLYCDEEYVYVYLSYNDTECIKIYDKAGSHVIDIPIEDIVNPPCGEYIYWAGTDSERIYFRKDIVIPYGEENIWGVQGNGYYELYYIEKSKLLEGDTEMKAFN